MSGNLSPAFFEGVLGGGDVLDLVVIESDNGHTFSAIIDFNRNTLQAIMAEKV